MNALEKDRMKERMRQIARIAWVALMVCLLTACGAAQTGGSDPAPTISTTEAPGETPEASDVPVEIPVNPDAPLPSEAAELRMEKDTGTVEQGEIEMNLHGRSGFTDFDSALLAFLEENGYRQESFLVSPLSFRAALALAVSGADGATKDALLDAMGFSSMEAVLDWYAGVLDGVRIFQEDLEQEQRWQAQYPEYDVSGVKPDRAYSIANSIWHNASLGGVLRENYIRQAEALFHAAAANVPADQITDAVNEWVNGETNGMIPFIAEDLSELDAVLVNALYLRTSWVKSFAEADTTWGDFTTVDGETVQKEFMRQQEHFSYYEDESCQLLVLPMKGDMRAMFVLGETGGVAEKLEQAEWTEVIVTLPKFEVETTLGGNVLLHYLEKMGAGVAFSDHADFSIMSNTPWRIADIIQKSKIKVDEDGIEAAAVTAILMEALAMAPDMAQPKVFTADRPFSFYIYNDTDMARELLFFGQYMK